MADLKLLYIEHEKRWKDKIEYDCTNAGIEVKLAVDPNGINSISDNDMMGFDLVLTDVFWFNQKTKKEDWARLGEVVRSVRKRNGRVPIIVLSEKPESQLEAEKYIKAGEVYDIWSKQGGYPQFLAHRVKNIIKIRQNEIGEKALLDHTKKACEGNSAAWCNSDILDFVKEYEGLTGEGIMLSETKMLFKKIGYKAGLDEVFLDRIVGAFIESEPLDMARSPKAWGHLRHSLSIFLAGYILLNSTKMHFQKDKIIEHLGVSNWEAVNKAWFLASALHDSCIFVEHLPILLEKIGNLYSNPLNRPVIAKDIGSGGSSSKEHNVDFGQIKNWNVKYHVKDKDIAEAILENVNKQGLKSTILNYMKTHTDHGILAAINLYNGIQDNHRCDPQVIKAASYPILIHNCIERIPEKLDEGKDFLVQLLCILDRFQAWGRENHYEELLEGTCFEKTVLREFDLSESVDKEAAGTLSMKIDYLPFGYISPSDKYLRVGEEKLISVLRKNFDSLSRIGLKRENNLLFWQGIKFKLSFYILGREISI